MAESKSHKRAKTGGSKGKVRTEVKIPGGRLDAKIGRLAREVEKSGNPERIAKAVKRLNTQKASKKELLVPNEHLDKAKNVAKDVAKGKLTIQNLSRTKRRFIK